MLQNILPSSLDFTDESIFFFKYFMSVAHPRDTLKQVMQAFYWACDRDPYLTMAMVTYRTLPTTVLDNREIKKKKNEESSLDFESHHLYQNGLTRYSLSFKGNSITYKVLPSIPFQTLFQTAVDRTLIVFDQQPDFPRNHESVHDLLYFFFTNLDDNSQIYISPGLEPRIDVFLTTLGNLILANKPLDFDASTLENEIEWAKPTEIVFFSSDFTKNKTSDEQQAVNDNRARIKCFQRLAAAEPDIPFYGEDYNVVSKVMNDYTKKGFLVKVGPNRHQIAPEHYEEFLLVQQEHGRQPLTKSDLELLMELYNRDIPIFTKEQTNLLYALAAKH